MGDILARSVSSDSSLDSSVLKIGRYTSHPRYVCILCISREWGVFQGNGVREGQHDLPVSAVSNSFSLKCLVHQGVLFCSSMFRALSVSYTRHTKVDKIQYPRCWVSQKMNKPTELQGSIGFKKKDKLWWEEDV